MRGTPASAAAAAPAAAPSAAALPEKIRAKLAEAREMAATADTKNHYELLGVPKNADENAIRNAFRKLARDFHADRFARYGLDKDAQSAVQKVFISINRAHETLSDPARRTEYDLGLEMRVGGSGRPGAAGGGAPQVDQVFKAEKLVKDATILISRGEAEPAIERLKQALAVMPEDPVAKAALAFAEHLVAQSQGGSQVVLRRALEAVEEICRDLDNREEPFLYLGRLYRGVGEQEKAIKAFEQALRINPHYAEAGSELRHAQRKVEQTKGSSSGLAGIFGRRKK
ncbi:MAG: DnaJ domain-containing protein [bacterium]